MALELVVVSSQMLLLHLSLVFSPFLGLGCEESPCSLKVLQFSFTRETFSLELRAVDCAIVIVSPPAVALAVQVNHRQIRGGLRRVFQTFLIAKKAPEIFLNELT